MFSEEKEEKAYSEYGIKRVILEIYDEMQRDLPPADRRVVHEACVMEM